MKKTNRKPLIITGVILFILGIGFMTYILVSKDDLKQPTTSTSTSAPASQKESAPTTSPTAVKTSSTEDLLLYLIEEEKLAHDVYTVMYQKYGARVFGNILSSEESHQAQVLTLLKARNIADPRSTSIGVFQNQELQSLYDQLIQQGSISETEAFKVGVIIEEKDIADISAQLSTATEQDVIDTLEKLRKGSENHLRAFNKQL